MAHAKRPNLDQAIDAWNALEEARTAFIDAVEAWYAALDTPPLTTAYQAWQAAVDAFNEATDDARVDYEGFIEDHSDKWQESERGQQYVDDAATLEQCQVTPEAEWPLDLRVEVEGETFVVHCDNAEEVLPQTPELPEPLA